MKARSTAERKTYQGKRKIKSSYLRPKDSKRKSSSTPGKVKGDNCKKNAEKVRFVKDSRWAKTDPAKYNKCYSEHFEKFYKSKA